MSQALDTMESDLGADHDAPPEVVETLADEDLQFKVWGGDWCPDCTGQLPRFAAVLDAAGVPTDRIDQYPVEKVDGEKEGPGMDGYGVEYIPTVVVFRGDEEVGRFVESADEPIAEHLANELAGGSS